MSPSEATAADDWDRHPFRGAFRIVDADQPEPKLWLAAIRTGGRTVRLGWFADPFRAGIAHDLALLNLGLPPVNFSNAHYRAVPAEHTATGLRTIRERLGLADEPSCNQP
ncbi:hypothetical protein SAMN02745157_4036 [Kaistia soli DSM 19436]|uniref:AP2 domain-containing protein n=1 Tax=Kaistia soli DSM 19436 TaxID=1122133 RepID=A0A1M5IXN6_9HYPH|nr:hypothetical protein [Kaistia soli]SHG33128.1 hypothetical protein SAMN02745157_4036 [Kaistia soli DSM 19436]